jgi:DNA gyrase subunit B
MATVAKNSTTTSYEVTDIHVLEGLEAVRRRPGMYIGSTDSRGLHHLVYEVVDNSVDEALAGACDRIEVSINSDDSVTVEDNGRGIPVGPHPTQKRSDGEPMNALEVVMTILHAGGKFGGGGYKVASGLHGVGVSAVNALSEWLEVEVRRDGKVYRQRYERGRPVTPVEEIGKAKSNETGTRTTFLADTTIFKTLDLKYETLLQRFREMAFLTRGLTIRFLDRRNVGNKPAEREMSFYFEGGIASFVRYLNKNREVLHAPVYVEKQINGTLVEAAIQYTDGYAESTFAFANNINTVDGGTHLTGFRSALTRSLNDYARGKGLLKDKDANFSGEDTRQGLTAVLNVKMTDPQFESQTKAKLGNAEVRGQVESVVGEVMSEFLEANGSQARKIIQKCITSSRAREAARQARDLVIRKSALESMTLPGKLADCSDRDPTKTEVFIVEGDSAGGSAKQGRDRRFQAILPLRGKILNVEKARLDRILGSNEIKAMITALGTGIGPQFSLENLRYNRVVVMTDADVDGSHIRTLLLTFFYRYMEPLIENGHLFIAQPPLYRIDIGREHRYVYTEEEKEQLLSQFQEQKISLQRYKGLGEMNPDQLWETTMNPEKRTLLQVTVEDAAAADRTFDMLMGNSVPPRKRFIQTHAKSVRNLDV